VDPATSVINIIHAAEHGLWPIADLATPDTAQFGSLMAPSDAACLHALIQERPSIKLRVIIFGLQATRARLQQKMI